MTTHKTMCRWCGREMLLKNVSIVRGGGCEWHCIGCACTSALFPHEAAALAWAEQPIPFLPEKIETKYATESDREWAFKVGGNCLTDTITAALAVREEEQK